jgi:hypothetical protein
MTMNIGGCIDSSGCFKCWHQPAWTARWRDGVPWHLRFTSAPLATSSFTAGKFLFNSKGSALSFTLEVSSNVLPTLQIWQCARGCIWGCFFDLFGQTQHQARFLWLYACIKNVHVIVSTWNRRCGRYAPYSCLDMSPNPKVPRSPANKACVTSVHYIARRIHKESPGGVWVVGLTISYLSTRIPA